jgi:hypothetical protein
MRRNTRILFPLTLAGALLAASVPCLAEEKTPGEPGRDECIAAVERVRKAMVILPPGSMARRFAESDAHQALVEAGNGEFDDCLEFAERAETEVRSPRHDLTAGDPVEPRRDGD